MVRLDGRPAAPLLAAGGSEVTATVVGIDVGERRRRPRNWASKGGSCSNSDGLNMNR